MKLTLISPRGFCAGVERAINIVDLVLKKFGPPIYVKHAIVHNKHVLDRFTQQGVIFVEDLEDIPDGQIVIFSAHGVSKDVYLQAKNKNLKEIDATCSLVTRVHSAVKRYQEKGYQIVLIGYRNHVEVQGTYGWAKDCTTIVENKKDAENLSLDSNRPIFLTSQTTLSLSDTKQIEDIIRRKYPHVETLPKGSICYATTNRQTALSKALQFADCAIVIGDQSSSNSKKLYELAQKTGVESYFILDESRLDLSLLNGKKSIVLTAGASVPEDVTEAVIKKISSLGNVEVDQYVDQVEDIHFSVPAFLD